ncbi:MAG TPA: DUF3570 domain-containing protein, partial [Opitutaceae bacterium]|nr:DUF3570 domain-containing protein [Opitutaceae bacterium]
MSSHCPRHRISVAQAGSIGLLLLLLAICLPRKASAENTLSYKWQRYDESGDRMRITTQSGMLDAQLPAELRFKLSGVVDAIAGASPTGQAAPAGSDQVPVGHLTDHRKAWDADLSRQFGRFNVALGYANSREHDYISKGVSINTLTDFNQKNTTLLVGYSNLDDNVKVPYAGIYTKKRADDVVVGITQLIDPETTLTFNIGYGQARGFLNDQYKVIQKTAQVLPGIFIPFVYPENLPRKRDKESLLLSANHAFKDIHGTAEATYRYFHDNEGINSHTIELAWYQKVGERLILKPNFRFYDQTANKYYRVSLDGTDVTPVNLPNGTGAKYTADYRLSALRTTDVGFKIIFTVREGLTLDASIDRYDMRGKDNVTSASAYPKAINYV